MCHNTSGLHQGKYSGLGKPVEFLRYGAGALVTEKGSGRGVEKKNKGIMGEGKKIGLEEIREEKNL